MEVENSTQNTPTPEAAAPVAEAAAPSVTDIDGLSEFMWQGEKRTPDWLHQVWNEHKNLSEQSKAWKEAERFDKNLDADIDAVLENPTLAQKFKQIYPPKYHTRLERELKRTGPSQASPTPAQASLPPEFQQRFDQMSQRLQFFEDRAYQAEVESASAQIDQVTKPLFEKFPLANENEVFTRAETMANAKVKLTDAAWERLIRESHEQVTKKSDRVYGARMKQQQEAGRRGVDTGPGGGAPGGSPKKAKTLAEAQEEWYQSVRTAR